MLAADGAGDRLRTIRIDRRDVGESGARFRPSFGERMEMILYSGAYKSTLRRDGRIQHSSCKRFRQVKFEPGPFNALRSNDRLIRAISARDMRRKESAVHEHAEREARVQDGSRRTRVLENHDSSDYVGGRQARGVSFPNLKPSTKTFSLRLPEALLGRRMNACSFPRVPGWAALHRTDRGSR